MRFMLDTDSCIALIKRKPEKMLDKLTSHAPGDIGLSTAAGAPGLPGGPLPQYSPVDISHGRVASRRLVP